MRDTEHDGSRVSVYIDESQLPAQTATKVQRLKVDGYRVVVDAGTCSAVVGDTHGVKPHTTRLTLYEGSLGRTMLAGFREASGISSSSPLPAVGALVLLPLLAFALAFTSMSTLFVLVAGLSGAIWVIALISGTVATPDKCYTLSRTDREAIVGAAQDYFSISKDLKA